MLRVLTQLDRWSMASVAVFLAYVVVTLLP
jgi:hypothetical protein